MTKEKDVMGNIERRLKHIAMLHFNKKIEDLSRDTRFDEDLGGDSLDLLEFVMQCEEEFDIQIPDNEVQDMKTLGEAFDYIAGVKK